MQGNRPAPCWWIASSLHMEESRLKNWTFHDLSIERAGDTRWLHTSMSPEQLWPLLKSFWDERGLRLALDQPQLGVMETEWAENRAKVPATGLRKYLGSFADGLFSSGERDQYRTRVERTAKGTDVYIAHKGLIEVADFKNRRQNPSGSTPHPILNSKPKCCRG